jgi:hypothetical protein
MSWFQAGKLVEETEPMSLNLKPEIEAWLVALAQASGVSVEDFLLLVVERKRPLRNIPVRAVQRNHHHAASIGALV